MLWVSRYCIRVGIHFIIRENAKELKCVINYSSLQCSPVGVFFFVKSLGTWRFTKYIFPFNNSIFETLKYIGRSSYFRICKMVNIINFFGDFTVPNFVHSFIVLVNLENIVDRTVFWSQAFPGNWLFKCVFILWRILTDFFWKLISYLLSVSEFRITKNKSS